MIKIPIQQFMNEPFVMVGGRINVVYNVSEMWCPD